MTKINNQKEENDTNSHTHTYNTKERKISMIQNEKYQQRAHYTFKYYATIHAQVILTQINIQKEMQQFGLKESDAIIEILKSCTLIMHYCPSIKKT